MPDTRVGWSCCTVDPETARVYVQSVCGYFCCLEGDTGKLVWDPTQPNGQPRRMLDTSRAEREFGFRAQIGFETGLARTIAWYREQVAGVAHR